MDLPIAEEVRAGGPLPAFDNSAMDGYAVVAGDTAAALGYKSDVKGRAEDRISETKERLTGAAGDAAAKAQQAMPDSARDGADRARQFVREQPVAVAAAAGFVVGLLLGRRRRED